ncbi:hypothetical protein B296_00058101 [Ensete ventricosum]|uniref:Proteasomal ATPase OB C-terminal domain-containing protein n=1 Tax=Ensete ventricosum TaxID=4639 RepID=A0A426XNG4_ENSVE|nr:hypothetical protein B296_00058101 [Ensete ventricosum]
MSDGGEDAVRRRNVVADYRKKLLQHKELDSRLRTLRENLRASKKEFTKTEDDLKSLQSVGQIIGEVLRPLDNERGKAPYRPVYTGSAVDRYADQLLPGGTAKIGHRRSISAVGSRF